MVVTRERSEVMESLNEVKREFEDLHLSITEGKNNNVQELTEITNAIDELQKNRKMIAETKETIPIKISEAERNANTKSPLKQERKRLQWCPHKRSSGV